VILPASGDTQVGLGVALTFKSQALKQPRTAFIARDVIGHDPVQLLLIEHVADSRFQCFLHQALALMRFVDVVTEITGLKRPASDAAEVAGADHLTVVRIQQREMHRQTGLESAGLHLKARADAFGAVVIDGANRRPPGEMPQVAPVEVAFQRRLFRVEHCQRQAFTGQGKQRHRALRFTGIVAQALRGQRENTTKPQAKKSPREGGQTVVS